MWWWFVVGVCAVLFISQRMQKGTAQVLRGRDLSGKVIVVTGANRPGIGFSTALAFAKAGAHVVVCCRRFVLQRVSRFADVDMTPSQSKADETARQLTAEAGRALQLTPMALDLSSGKSIVAFSQHYRRLKLPLHVLVCNAAVYAPAQATTAEGIEVCVPV